MRRQVDRNEGTESGLNVRQKKGEPVETANASARRCGISSRRRLLRGRRGYKNALGRAAERAAVNGQCKR